MHSLIIASLTGVLWLLSVFGLQFSPAPLALLVAVGVGVVGLPHGGLDHRIGQQVLSSLSAGSSTILFFASYLTIAILVIAGWFMSPWITISGFFCLSAWHFGLEEDERVSRNLWQWAGMVARGGMVIWVPTLFHGGEISRLLSIITSGDSLHVAEQIVSAIQLLAPALIALTVWDAVSYRNDRQPERFGLSSAWQHRIRLANFGLLFAIAHPLVSFGVYFCGWHSIRGLVHLYQTFGGPVRKFGLSLLPITAAALGLFAVGFSFSFQNGQLSPAVIQTVFIGLSAVAIPHLLLHVISDSLAARQCGHWGGVTV